ncbi:MULTISPECIES: DUF5707 domain-containing protein [unclassified Streptomyces]|uniref:DUF5707 domain-containing protein n=1 Tax=unclassified Streptomyces TaxID=2593676 RepID=UPI000372D683|nr:DUF5707 domain-containing protein [Streptomyces sp. KhCrAH-43]MYS34329.1 hypothetical protein [Streptomyces sp. SID4920]MYX68506.1 hypothetical protein [Streptomyces sp. SID8373]
MDTITGRTIMSRRIIVGSAAALVILGGAGAFALAHAEEQPPVLEKNTARYSAPAGDREGSFTFTTDVKAASGVRSLKVLAWPAAGPFTKNPLTKKDLAGVDSATCKPAGEDTVHCTYKVTVSAAEAADSGTGRWYVATLATAGNGDTTFNDKTATFTVG